MDSRPKMNDQGLNDDILVVDSPPEPVIDLLSDADSDSGSDTLRQQPVSSAAAAAASSRWKTGRKSASSTDPANRAFPPSQQQTRPSNSAQAVAQDSGLPKTVATKQVTTLLLLDSDSDYSDVEWCEGPDTAPAPLPERAGEESGESAQTFSTEPETPVHEEGTASPRDGQMRDCAHTGGESWVFDFEKQGETLREEHGEEAENVVHVEVRVLNGGNSDGFEHPPPAKQQSSDESTCLGSTVISITEDGGTELDRSFSAPVTSDPFVSQVEIRIENDGSGNKKDDEEDDSGNRTNALNDFDSEWNVLEAGKHNRCVISSSSVQPLVSSCEEEQTLSVLQGGSDALPHSQLPEGKEANQSDDCTRKRKSSDTVTCDGGPTSSKRPTIASVSGPRNVSDEDPDMRGDSQARTNQGEEADCRKSSGGSPKPATQAIQQMCQQLKEPVRPVLFVKSSQSGVMFSALFDSLQTSECEESNLAAHHKDWSNSVQSTQQGCESGAWPAEGGQEETAETRQHPGAQLEQAPHTTPSVSAPLPSVPAPERPHSEDSHTMHVIVNDEEEDLPPGPELTGCESEGGSVVPSPTRPPDKAKNCGAAKSSRLPSGASSTHAHTRFRWDDDDEDDDDGGGLSSELQAPSAASRAENTENGKGDDACSSQAQPASWKEPDASDTVLVPVGDDRGSLMQRRVFATHYSTLQDQTFLAHLRRSQPSGKLLNFLLNAQDQKFSVCGHCVEAGIKSVHVAWGSTALKMSNVQGVLMASLMEMVRQNLMECSVFSHPLLQRREYPAVWSLVTRGNNTSLTDVSLVFLLLIMEDMLHNWMLDGSMADRVRTRLKTPIVIAQPGCSWGLNAVYRRPEHACSSVLSGLPLQEWRSPALSNGAPGERFATRDQLERQFVFLWKSMFQPNFQHPFQKSLHWMYPLCPCEQLSTLDKAERSWWRKVEGNPKPIRMDNLGLLRFMGHNVFCFLGRETLYISAVELEQRDLLPGNYRRVLSSRFKDHLMLRNDARFMTKPEWTFLTQFFSGSSTSWQQWEQTPEKMVFTPFGLRQIFMKLSSQQFKYNEHAKAVYYMMTLGHHCPWSLLVTPPTTQLHKVPGYPHSDAEEQAAAMIIPQAVTASSSAQKQPVVTYYDGGGGTPPGVKLVEESLNEALRSTIYRLGLQAVAEPFCTCRLMATQLDKYRFLEFDGVELNHVTQMTLADHTLHCWKRPDGFYVSVVELRAKGLCVYLPGHGYLYSYMLEDEKVFLTSVQHSPRTGLKPYRLIHIASLHRLYQQSAKAAFHKLARHKFRIKLWKHSCPLEDGGRCDLRPGLVEEPAAEAVSSDAVMGDEETVDVEVIDDSDSERPAVPELSNNSDAERPALPPGTDLPETGGHAPSPASSIVDLADSDGSGMSSGEEAEVDNSMSVGDEVEVENVVDLDPNHADQTGPVENRPSEPSSSGAGPSGVAVSRERPLSPSSCSVGGSTASRIAESDRRLPQTADHALTVSSQVKQRMRECLAKAKLPVHHPGRGIAPEAVDVPEGSSVQRHAPLVVSRMDDERSVTDLMNMLTEQTTQGGGCTTAPTLDVKLLKACQCPDRKASVFPMYSFLQCLYTAQSPFMVLQQLGQAVVLGKLVLCSYRGGSVFFSFLDLKKAGILTENSLEDMKRQLLSQNMSPSSKDARSVLLYELEAITDILKSSQNVDSLLISAQLVGLLPQKSGENGASLIHLHRIGHICPQAGCVAHRVQRHDPHMSHVQSAWMRAFRWSQDLEQQLAARRASPPTRSRCSSGCTALLETKPAGRSAGDGLAVFLRSENNQEKRVMRSGPPEKTSQYFSLTPVPWEKIAAPQVSCGEKLTSHIKSEAACSEPSNQDTLAFHQNAGTCHRKADVAPITRIKQEIVDTSVKQEPGSPGSKIMTGSNLSTGSCVCAGSVSLPGSVIPRDEDFRVKREPEEREHGLHCSCGDDHEETKVDLLSLDTVDIKPELGAVSCDLVNNTCDHSETECAQLHEDRKVGVASVSLSNTGRGENSSHGCVTIQYNHGTENPACPVHTSMPKVTDALVPCERSKAKDVAKSSMVEGVAVDCVTRQVKVVKDDKKLPQVTEGQTTLRHIVLMGILNTEERRYMCLGIEGRIYVNWAEVVQDLIPDDRVLLFVQAQALHAYLYLPPDSVNERLDRCFGCDVDLLHSAPWVCVNTLVAIYNMGSGMLPREKFLKRFVDITPDSFFFPFFLLVRKT